VTGDLAAWLPGRTWGGLFNEIAILLFYWKYRPGRLSSVPPGSKRDRPANQPKAQSNSTR